MHRIILLLLAVSFLHAEEVADPSRLARVTKEAEAREIEEEQAKGLCYYGNAWITPEEMESLREQDRKEAGWALVTRVDTPHVSIFSGRSLEITRYFADTLENESAVYRDLYGKVWKLKEASGKIRVFLFADRETFLRARAQIISDDQGRLGWMV